MAIHQRWAEAIMNGQKRVEFRKRRLADDITVVLVYATAPVSKIVGRFTVRQVVSGSPVSIWDEYGSAGVIEHDAFFSYYDGTESAVAIVVGEAVRFDEPVALDQIEPKPSVPQSFAYLTAESMHLALTA